MRFNNFDEILSDCLWLEEVIHHLQADQFPFRTREEISRDKKELVESIQMDTSFKLFTKLESYLRTDLDSSLKSNHRDSISKLYKEIIQKKIVSKKGNSYRDRAKKLSMNDLFNGLREYYFIRTDPSQRDLSRAIKLLKFRHWYAHGRYFSLPPQIPEPNEVYDIVNSIYNKILLRIRRSHSAI